MKKIGYALFICCICVALVTMIKYSNKHENSKEQDIYEIDTEEYEAIFLSMYDVSSYSEENFSMHCGKKIFIFETNINDFTDFSNYIKKIRNENPTIKSIYLGVNPTELWSAEQKEGNTWLQESVVEFNSLFLENFDIRFEIVLPYPQIAYWERLTQVQMNEELDMYERIVQMCENFTNVTVDYMSAEEWLVFDSDNYEQNEFLVKRNVANKLVEGIATGKYAVTVDSVKAQNCYLKKQVEEKCSVVDSNVDLSEWNIVFFGDSIVGLEHSNTSIPNLVKRLTEANTYNMGIGGASASKSTKGTASFYEMVEMGELKIADGILENKDFFSEVRRFMDEYKKGSKLCFVINFGINDYINGSMIEDKENQYNVETYMGALRVAIEKLQKEFPNAEFIVMTPTYINSFLEGEEQNSVSECVLQEYREAVKVIAEEYDIYCKDNYEDLDIDESNYWKYYLDDIHLNGTGRFIFAESFIDYFETNMLM